jgi:peroxiredoxin Q/BCP
MSLLTPGSKAPDFSVADHTGKAIKLSDFKGKKVVLYFYPKDMTPGCTAQACSLRDNYKELIAKGYVVLGISSDDAKSHQKFIAKEKLPFTLLADTERKVHEAYGTWVEKSMYGRKYMGTARVTYVINENGIIKEVIEKVDTKHHAAQILKTEPKAAPVKNETATKAPAKKAGKATGKKAAKKKPTTKKSAAKPAKKKAVKTVKKKK